MYYGANVRFEGETVAIPSELQSLMAGVSWHAKLPGGFAPPRFEDLRLLRISHWSLDGAQSKGELIVAKRVAENVLRVFEQIYAVRFPIAKMNLMHTYGGSDLGSMDDNNSSGFNARLIAGTQVASRHAYGLAIDINPLQNPYVTRGNVQPAAAKPYVNRALQRPGMLRPRGPVVRAFANIGWVWGGQWRTIKDYHHFELQA